jgi:DNA-binding MarR family transcriptional regulator
VTERAANLLAAASQLVADTVSERLATVLPHTASAPAALLTVAHHPGLSIEELSRALRLTHSGTVRLVDRLEADHLLRRQKDRRRALKLRLTPRGRRAIGRIERARIAGVADLLAVLTEKQQRQLEAVLAEFLFERTKSHEDLRRICRLCSFTACETEAYSCPVAEAADRSSFAQRKHSRRA